MTGMNDSQIPKRFLDVIEHELEVFRAGRTVQVVNEIPDTTQIPIEDRKHWLRIPDVVCVFIDMVGSTRLSAQQYDKSTAGAYQLFTETAVRLMNAFEAPYIDVRGDGAFALFNRGQEYRALAAAVTFKTFAENEFTPRIEKATDLEVGAHIGIDQKTLLVRKVGLKRAGGRSDRQNEVWAGKCVNMAAKLAAAATPGQLLVSDRFYGRITDDHARMSCGCPTGIKTSLWEELDLGWEDQFDEDQFDFEKAYLLKSKWCTEHGAEYCEALLALGDS